MKLLHPKKKKKQFTKKLTTNMWSELSTKHINNNRNTHSHCNLVTISTTSQVNKNTFNSTNQHLSLLTLSNCNGNRRMSQSLSLFDLNVNNTNTDMKNHNDKTIGINKRQYNNYYSSTISLKKQLDKKEMFYSTNHSIFSLFRRNFKHKFNSFIDQTLKQQCKTSLNFKPSNAKSQDNQSQTINDNNNNSNAHATKLNVSNNDPTANKEASSSQLNFPKVKSSFKSLSPSSSPSNSFNEPSDLKIAKYKRTRNFSHYMNSEYILNSKWKIKEGIYSADIIYNKALSLDLSFQSKYIKDEIKLLLDNIHYMRTNLLFTNDIITAIKNKNLQFQININKSIEETIAFVNMISRIILKHKGDYYDGLLSHDNVDLNAELQTLSITNEVECFVCNIKLLCKLSSYLESCFEMYLRCVSKANEFVLPLKKFEVLKRLLQKTRYNVNLIVQSGKRALKDFYHDKDVIGKIDNVLKKDVISKYDIQGCTRKKRKDLIEHFRSQLDFKKNEFALKRRRIIRALEEKKEEIEVDKYDEHNQEKKGKTCGLGAVKHNQVKNYNRNANHKGKKQFMYHMKAVDGTTMNGPMSIIVSVL